MRHLILAAALAATFACAPAEAAGHNRALYRSHCNGASCWVTPEAQRPALELRKLRAKPRAGRPRAWCGWFARQLVGQDPGIAFNLARNWARWGRPASPGVGVMVVWVHHVGMITGRTPDGRWIVKSGNDGGGVRERPRSLAGAIAFRAG
jgi:hypothetical protein